MGACWWDFVTLSVLCQENDVLISGVRSLGWAIFLSPGKCGDWLSAVFNVTKRSHNAICMIIPWKKIKHKKIIFLLYFHLLGMINVVGGIVQNDVAVQHEFESRVHPQDLGRLLWDLSLTQMVIWMCWSNGNPYDKTSHPIRMKNDQHWSRGQPCVHLLVQSKCQEENSWFKVSYIMKWQRMKAWWSIKNNASTNIYTQSLDTRVVFHNTFQGTKPLYYIIIWWQMTNIWPFGIGFQ